jgi:uncharacterized protein YndB with AHSA1/START domain
LPKRCDGREASSAFQKELREFAQLLKPKFLLHAREVSLVYDRSIMNIANFDPQLDLGFERKVSCSVEHLWKGWTDAETLKEWFCPKPWQVVEASIDLRPGGRFWTVMQGPQGERHEGASCYLEVIPQRRLVWTSALLPGFRPAPVPAEGFTFTAKIEFESTPGGVLYRATVMHRTVAERELHQKMGFEQGWGIALDQLLALG